MKKIFFVLSVLFISISPGLSQLVPNGDFESWSFVDGFDEPDAWETNNANGYVAVAKTSDSYSGDFAMQVTSTAWGTGGHEPGIANTTFIPSLDGDIAVYIKCDSLIGIASVRVKLLGYQNGNLIPDIGFWETDIEIPDYTRIEIPVTSTEIYDSIKIHVLAVAGFDSQGNQLGYSRIKIDDITEIQLNGLSEADQKSTVHIYPNPVADELLISVENENLPFQFFIYDEAGKLIYKGISKTEKIIINTQNWQQGKYILKLQNDSGTMLAKPVFIKGG